MFTVSGPQAMHAYTVWGPQAMHVYTVWGPQAMLFQALKLCMFTVSGPQAMHVYCFRLPPIAETILWGGIF
jgi:hypothetical protein